MPEPFSTGALHPYRSVEFATDGPALRRSLCILACALSVLGAFLVIVKLSWLLPVRILRFDWFPYVAHVLAAACSGAALVGATPSRSWRDGAAGGALAIVLLALVSFGIPGAFWWIPVRTSSPWLVVAAIFVASAACSGLATRFAAARPSRTMASVVFLGITITTTIVFLGRCIVRAALVEPEIVTTVAVATVAAFASAILTQSVVPLRRIVACSLGIPFLAATDLAETLHHWYRTGGHPTFDASILALVLPVLPWTAAALGARLAPPWIRKGLRDVGHASREAA